MWYISTTNGGCYRHIRNEYPTDEVMSNLLDSLTSKNIKFWVHCIQYEYNGWNHDVELINDETLDTIHVFHDICWEHSGVEFWYIEVVNEHCRNTIVYDSRYGLIADLLSNAWKQAAKRANTLCLPCITPAMEMHRELDILHRKMLGKPARPFEQLKKEYPYSYESLIEVELASLKTVLQPKPKNTRDVLGEPTLDSDDVIVL